MTKYILDKHNISTPKGLLYTNKEQISYSEWENQSIVIKPLDTNFGLGISILSHKYNEEEFYHAIDLAFSYSKQIIIEQYIKGKEYRFLIIDDKCVSIIHRDGCNVIGDGQSSILQLVENKNLNPLRGTNYKFPLEKIKIDDEVKSILKNQNLSLDSVIPQGQKVYLRNNSNISTGGDSHEVFDFIPCYFKKLAVEATKALNVKICGIDMIIEDIYQPYGCIIEANYNPAIMIHAYPLTGIGKDVSEAVINTVLKYDKRS